MTGRNAAGLQDVNARSVQPTYAPQTEGDAGYPDFRLKDKQGNLLREAPWKATELTDVSTVSMLPAVGPVAWPTEDTEFFWNRHESYEALLQWCLEGVWAPTDALAQQKVYWPGLLHLLQTAEVDLEHVVRLAPEARKYITKEGIEEAWHAVVDACQQCPEVRRIEAELSPIRDLVDEFRVTVMVRTRLAPQQSLREERAVLDRMVHYMDRAGIIRFLVYVR